ncbi:MAG: hypothetical protein JKY96_02930 [Phycisphaerales bacterium]|nr:hypothetical protein [Phycisphaerales bacterium]
MPTWLMILILAIAVVGTIIGLIAMFTEMGVKRSTGTMKTSRSSKTKRSGQGGSKKRK